PSNRQAMKSLEALPRRAAGHAGEDPDNNSGSIGCEEGSPRRLGGSSASLLNLLLVPHCPAPQSRLRPLGHLIELVLHQKWRQVRQAISREAINLARPRVTFTGLRLQQMTFVLRAAIGAAVASLRRKKGACGPPQRDKRHWANPSYRVALPINDGEPPSQHLWNNHDGAGIKVMPMAPQVYGNYTTMGTGTDPSLLIMILLMVQRTTVNWATFGGIRLDIHSLLCSSLLLPRLCGCKLRLQFTREWGGVSMSGT
ncbi:hypothetical protein THAOC_28854, partial [Thalassiosira oceanica]